MPPKGWKKPVAPDVTVRGPVAAVVQEMPTPTFVADAAVAVYRDPAGAPRGQAISEGRDNFAAVTAEAHKTVALAMGGGHG